MKWLREKKAIRFLKEYPKNPRRLTKKQERDLKASIEQFGQCEPLVINCDNTIIGGHQRFRILQKLGYEVVEVCVPEFPLSDKQVEELNIRLNKNGGAFDFDILANEWELDELIEWGFEEEELTGEALEDKPKKAKEPKLVIQACCLEDLRMIEKEIAPIVDQIIGATCEVRI